MPLNILHISDTHNQHRKLTNLPKADIIVHSGDFCFAGTENEAFDFINWFCDLPYKHKIFIAGNHDECLYRAYSIEGLDENCHYLYNSGIEIEGIKFYGLPYFMQDTLTDEYQHHLKLIPQDINVLITHNPPYGILDSSNGKHYGNRELLNQVFHHEHIKYHLFGHIHDHPGSIVEKGICFHNGSCVDGKYNAHNIKLEVFTMNFQCQE